MELTRVLVAAASGRLLGDVLGEVIRAEPDMELFRHDGPDEGVASTARRVRAHVVIVTEAPRRLAHAFDRLLEVQPGTRILSLQRNGRQAFLYRLRPELVELGELSPETLMAAIRDRGESARC